MDKLMNISLNPASHLPIFLQIQKQIETAVMEGAVKVGQRLPSERDLASHLGISRGTVKKAYENLIHEGLLEARKGRGSFVCGRPVEEHKSRLAQAMEEVERTIFHLEKLGFSHQRIENLFTTRLEERKDRLSDFSVAAVECNPEALQVYMEQLSTLSHCNYKKILLSDLRAARSPEQLLSPYELIIVTTTHYRDLTALAPNLEGRFVQVGVGPTPNTLVSLGTLLQSQRIGILHHSDRFLTIVKRWISRFHSNMRMEGFKSSIKGELTEFLKEKEVLVVPPASTLGLAGHHLEDIRDFRQAGGKIIYFEYHIEDGSLKQLETVFSSLLDTLD